MQERVYFPPGRRNSFQWLPPVAMLFSHNISDAPSLKTVVADHTFLAAILGPDAQSRTQLLRSSDVLPPHAVAKAYFKKEKENNNKNKQENKCEYNSIWNKYEKTPA